MHQLYWEAGENFSQSEPQKGEEWIQSINLCIIR